MAATGKSNASMCFECLESRQLMSVSATLDNGVLVITGTEGAQQLAELAVEHGMSAFIVMGDDADLLRRFAGEVADAHVLQTGDAERGRVPQCMLDQRAPLRLAEPVREADQVDLFEPGGLVARAKPCG